MLRHGEWVEMKLQRIAEKARREPDFKFTSLFHLNQDPMPIKLLASSINKFFWYRKKVSEGCKGRGLSNTSSPKGELCFRTRDFLRRLYGFLVRRTMGKEPGYSFFISNAPASTRLETFVWLSGLR